MADQSISSSSISFQEPPFRYTEGKNMMYYQNIKMNLQDIQRLTNKTNADLMVVQKKMNNTVKMINFISTHSAADDN